MSDKIDLIKDLGALAIASRLRRLSDILTSDVADIYEKSGFKISPRYFPFLNALKCKGSLGVTDLAKVLGLTHPAVSQILRPLQTEGWVVVEESATDARCRTLTLSNQAKKVLKDVEPLWEDIRDAIEEVLTTSNCDFLTTISSIEEELARKSLCDRVIKADFKDHNPGTIIVEWDPRYLTSFIDLNVEWLEKYFEVEKKDKIIFDDPSQIIKDGGMIFFAKLGTMIVGTCALFKHCNTHYEIAKMAVSPHTQSRGTGRQLLEHVIDYAKTKGAKRITLESVESLINAQKLYKSVGFKKIPLPIEGSQYKRVNVAMELLL
jgi:DNA-binding MarR family transcriptional regulator/ribosomal protein S18 acetylase RimI-like enzyme